MITGYYWEEWSLVIEVNEAERYLGFHEDWNMFAVELLHCPTPIAFKYFKTEVLSFPPKKALLLLI